MELAPPKRGLYIRYLVSELERVHSHLLWLGVAGHEAGFDSFFMYTWRDREVVMDLLEMISGNRVHYAINTLGGVRRDIDEGQKAEDPRRRGRPAEAERVLLQDRGHRADLRRPVGRRRPAEPRNRPWPSAPSAPWPGPRASPATSARTTRTPSTTKSTSTSHGRHLRRPRPDRRPDQGALRVLQDLRTDPQEPARRATSPSRRRAKPSPNEVVSRYEAPRGENIHYIKANGSDKPERLKVRAPTLANYPATVEMLRNGFIADIPLIFAAIDPCICCAERTVTWSTPGPAKNPSSG